MIDVDAGSVVVLVAVLCAGALWSCSSSISQIGPNEISSANLDGERNIDLRWVYVNEDIKWESPPKQIQQTFKGSLNSTLVVFYPSGKFASVGCTLYRNTTTKKIDLSAGDDFSVLTGIWTRNDDGSITSKARMTHGAVVNIPEQIQIWKVREPSADRLAESLEVNGQVYVSLPEIGNFKDLSPMIADVNQPMSTR